MCIFRSVEKIIEWRIFLSLSIIFFYDLSEIGMNFYYLRNPLESSLVICLFKLYYCCLIILVIFNLILFDFFHSLIITQSFKPQ